MPRDNVDRLLRVAVAACLLLASSLAPAVDTPADIYKKIQLAIQYLLLNDDTRVVWTLTPPVAASYEVFARWVVKPGNTATALAIEQFVNRAHRVDVVN